MSSVPPELFPPAPQTSPAPPDTEHHGSSEHARGFGKQDHLGDTLGPDMGGQHHPVGPAWISLLSVDCRQHDDRQHEADDGHQGTADDPSNSMAPPCPRTETAAHSLVAMLTRHDAALQ
jgi:hypothetical protein